MMLAGDLAGDCEAKPGAGRFCLVEPHEPLEDALAVGWGYSGAVVEHAYLHLRASAFGSHVDPAVHRCGGECVLEQVADDAQQPVGIAAYLRFLRRETDRWCGGAEAGFLDRRMQEGGEIERLYSWVVGSFEAGEAEQVVDQSPEA